jgi:hypothetical protein
LRSSTLVRPRCKLAATNEKSRSHPPAFSSFKRRLAHQLAANGSKGSDQSGSQQQQGGWLGDGCAGASEDVKGADRLCAVGIPGAVISAAVLASAGGIQVGSGGAGGIEVPSVKSIRGQVGWAEDQEVRRTRDQVDSGDAANRYQAAALTEGLGGGQVAPLLDQGARELPLAEYRAAKNEFAPAAVPIPISICETLPDAPAVNSLAAVKLSPRIPLPATVQPSQQLYTLVPVPRSEYNVD